MTKTDLKGTMLIAPCGINCGVCRAHLRARNACPGCRADDADKPKTRVVCKIKTCRKLATMRSGYCFDCDEFPCAPLAHLDVRYRTKYAASPVENLLNIQKTGVRKFIQAEDVKWTCPKCGGVLCMHDPECHTCGYAWHSSAGRAVRLS